MADIAVSGTLNLPSTWKRFLALVIDGVVLSLPTLLGFLLGWFKVEGGEVVFPWVPYLLSAAISAGFYFFCLIHWSRTPGKMLFGLYITDAETLRPGLSAKQAVLRMLGGILSIPFSLAPQSYALLRTDRRQLSDLIAGTQVLQVVPRKEPPKARWIIGGLAVAYFAITGVITLVNSSKTLKFSAEGISMSLAAPGTTLAAKPAKPAPEAAKAPAPAAVGAEAPASAKAAAATPVSAPALAPANSGVSKPAGVATTIGTQLTSTGPNPRTLDRPIAPDTEEEAARPPGAKPQSASGTGKLSRAGEDARRCLVLASNPEVIKCVNAYR